MFTAYTSPNDMFSTVKEISFKVAHASKYAPYALVAFEFGGDSSGQADGGPRKARISNSASVRAGRSPTARRPSPFP